MTERKNERERQREKYQNEDRLKDEQGGRITERKTYKKIESGKDKKRHI